MSDTARSSRYEIRVEGVLDPRWTAWFEGLAIGSDDSQTVISGPVAGVAGQRDAALDHAGRSTRLTASK